MAGRRKPIQDAGDTSGGEFARDARAVAQGSRGKARKRARGRQAPPETYVAAEAAQRVGDHAITPDLVRGVSAPRVSREVLVSRNKGPAAAPIIADLLTVFWGEIYHLRSQQDSTGQPLPPDQFEKLRDLADGVTKVLREERRQNELDDWSRLSSAEIVATLPPEYQKALSPLLGEGEPEE